MNNYSFSANVSYLEEIVKVEQPITFSVLCKRMAPLFGRQKVTSYVIDAVQRTIARSKYLKKISNYYTIDDTTNMILRINSDRRPEDIPIIEFENAILLLLKLDPYQSCDHICDSILRALGYKRHTEQLKKVIKKVILSLERNNKIKQIDNAYLLADEI